MKTLIGVSSEPAPTRTREVMKLKVFCYSCNQMLHLHGAPVEPEFELTLPAEVYWDQVLSEIARTKHHSPPIHAMLELDGNVEITLGEDGRVRIVTKAGYPPSIWMRHVQ